MKKAYSTIVLVLGIGLVGFLFAQQSGGSHGDPARDNQNSGTFIQDQKEPDEAGEINRMDSSHSLAWFEHVVIPEDFQDRLTEIFRNLEENFAVLYGDSTSLPEGIQRFFNENLQRKLEHFHAEILNGHFLERLDESLEKLHDQDFRLQWDQDFNRQLRENLENMQERLEELDQRLQENGRCGKAI
ncbi:MAG: hypothetical protein KFF73_14735 [Cyclobacteriaceae bacterium]|nr:hypothetical protein [Cyclobacteriaceae bacterium]